MPGMFTIHRDGDLSQALAVNFELGGLATNGVDYTYVNSPVFFAQGAANVSIPIVPISDTVAEAESVVLTVTAGDGYVSGASASVFINDVAPAPQVQNLGQHNNYEHSDEFDPLPPGADVNGARVGQGNGDLLLPLKDLVSTAASALSSYLFPTNVSGGDSQMSVDATILLPATPTAVTVDVEVRNSTGSIVGYTTLIPSATALPANQNGTMSLQIDPAGLKNSAGAPVPALATGNYSVTANIRADLPGSTPVTIIFPAATTSVQYVNPNDRSFSRGFSASGVNRLRVDSTGISLNRSNGTSMRFANAGAAFTAPEGSFTTAESFSTNVPDPLGGANRVAAYRLTGASGMISLYSAAGLLLERCEPNGDVIRFAYQDRKNDGTPDDLVRVQSVHTGQVVDYAYVGGRIQTVTDWAGRAWTYAYDSVSGLLTSMTGPAPQVGLPAPRVLMTYHPGTTRIASYTSTDTASTITETTQVDWDAAGNVSQIRKLDTQGNSGGTRTWTFQSAESRQMNQIRVIDPLAEFDPQDAYDQLTFPDGSIAKSIVDQYGNVIREERTVLGYLANTVITTHYTRNADGQLTAHGPIEQRVGTNAATVIPAVTYGYDSAGRQISATYLDGTTEAWTFNAGASAVQPSTYKNRVGHYFTYGPYSNSSPTQINRFSSNGGTLISQTRYTYLNGRIKTMAMTDPNGLNGTGVGVEMYYDSRLNLIHSRTTTATDAGVISPAAPMDIWVSYGYNAQDNLIWSTSQFQATALASVPAVPSATDVNLVAVRTDVTTDVQGRILTSLSPVPGVGQARLLTTMTYDAVGRLLTSAEPGTTTLATRRTAVAYNSFGELRSMSSPDPDDAGPLAVPSTVFVYDLNGFTSETRQMNGSAVVSRKRFGFDSLGRMRFESMALSATAPLQTNEMTQYEYDAVGRVTKTFSPVGKTGLAENKFLVTTQVYNDVLRRVTTSVSTSGVGVINLNVTDTIQEFDAIGRPTKVAQGALSRTMRYLDNSTWAGKGTLVAINDERTSDTDLAATKQWWVKYGPTGLVRRTQTPDPDATGPLALLDTTTAYDYRGNVDTVTEVSGSLSRTTDYVFDFRDLLQTFTTPAPSPGLPALVTLYGYDRLQRQVSETGPSGVSQVIGWRNDGLLGTLSRNDNGSPVPGIYTTYSYDNLNRVTGFSTPDGLSTVAYDALGNISQTRSPDPDGTGPLTPVSMTYIYASGTAGQFLQETLDTDNSQTKFSFDSAGRLIEQFRPQNLNPVGSDYTNVYAGGTASTTPTETWTYDALGQLRTSTDALGNSITYQYDSLSRLTSVGDNTRRQSYVYSATNGDLTSTTDPLGRTTQLTGYDGLGRLTQSQRMLGTSVSDVSTIAYDGFGRVSQTKALAGVAGKEMVTSYQYDLLDRQTKVIDPLLGQTNYTYDVRGFLSRVDNERNHSAYLNYDNIGRLSAQWTEGFSQSVGSQRYTYDAMDRVAVSTDPLNNLTTYAYDNLGRQILQTDPVQAAGTPTTAYTYDLDGNLASLTDPSGNVTSYRYDHRNRLREDSITLNGLPAIREYWYTNTDKLFWSKDRENRWTRYAYDFAFGAADNYRLKEESWWVSGSIFNNRITYSYDNAQGNGLLVTEVNDRKNLQTSDTITSRVGFTYDQLARVITTTDWLQPGTKAEGFELKYFYADGVDRRTGTEARFAKFNTTTGAQTNNYFDFRNSYVWDRLNRVDTVTQRSASDPLAATWTANATTTRTVDLNYFADSTLQSISRTQGAAGATTAAMVTTFTTVADGSKNEGRIASITHSGLTDGNVAYAYAYDDHGRVSSFTSPAGTRTYQYDSFDQVIGASGAAQTAESYNYDTNGNRTSAAIVTGQYNRITSDGTYSYQYDKEGNRTRRTLTGTGEYEVYVWDYRQRLVSVTKRSAVNAVLQTVTYEYDGLDRRIRRTVANSAGTVTTQQRFLYDTNVLSSLLPLGGEGARRADEGAVWEVVIVLDERLAGESYQKVDHRYMNGPAIDQVFADETGGNGVLWYLSDTQNTVRDVAKFASTSTGSLATVRNHLEYNTFGNVTSADDPTTATVNDGDRPGLEGTGNEFSPQRSYTGREPDPSTGLIYYRARWFDPRTGRFISEDPIGFAAGDANLSRYVGNSTPNAVDPSGLEGWVVFLPEPEPVDLYAGEKQYYERIRARQEREVLEQAADAQSRRGNPRVTQILNADGSVSTVTDSMDEGIRAELESSVIGSTRSPRRYGKPGENLGQCIQPGTAAVPFQDADWNDVRQERLAYEAELDRSRLIMEIGVVSVPMMVIPGPDDLLLLGLGGRLKQASVAAKAIDGADDAARLAPVRTTTPIGELRRTGQKDAHHIIQDAAVRDLPGYNTNLAPGVRLDGPANVPGTPHSRTRPVQREAGGGTYGAERQIGYKALRRAGETPADARSLIEQGDDYFHSIGVNRNTPTTIPGDRR